MEVYDDVLEGDCSHGKPRDQNCPECRRSLIRWWNKVLSVKRPPGARFGVIRSQRWHDDDIMEGR